MRAALDDATVVQYHVLIEHNHTLWLECRSIPVDSSCVGLLVVGRFVRMPIQTIVPVGGRRLGLDDYQVLPFAFSPAFTVRIPAQAGTQFRSTVPMSAGSVLKSVTRVSRHHVSEVSVQPFSQDIMDIVLPFTELQFVVCLGNHLDLSVISGRPRRQIAL